FKLLIYTWARKSEKRAITWLDINFSYKYIHIEKNDYHGTVTTPKTKAAIRYIYLPQHVIDDLTEYQSWYKNKNIYKDDYVLFGTFFKSFSESTIDRWFTTSLNVLDDNLPDGQTFQRIFIHELRHSHASHLINHGANIMIIAKRLGHADTTEVMNR
ncbi:site-specific integrase, partial [Staphylococcus sp. MB371]